MPAHWRRHCSAITMTVMHWANAPSLPTVTLLSFSGAFFPLPTVWCVLCFRIKGYYLTWVFACVVNINHTRGNSEKGEELPWELRYNKPLSTGMHCFGPQAGDWTTVQGFEIGQAVWQDVWTWAYYSLSLSGGQERRYSVYSAVLCLTQIPPHSDKHT